MATYKAPLRDMRFVLYELHRGDTLAQLTAFEEMTPDLIDPVLEQAARTCRLHTLGRPMCASGQSATTRLVRGGSAFGPLTDL